VHRDLRIKLRARWQTWISRVGTLYRILITIRRLFLICCFTLAAGGNQVCAQAAEREQKIKAAYLYHLAQFIDWPKTHALRTTAHITICTYKDSAFNAYLQSLQQRKAKGREIRVQTLPSNKFETQCNIIFTDSQHEPKSPLLKQYAENGTITVGELPSFIEGGGLIALTTFENHVRLLINFEKAKASGLYVSANLLEVATIVSPLAKQER
jgi:hypothetical protein